jgi:hypothetical protein
MKREGTIRVYDSSLHVWEEHCDHTMVKEILPPAIRFLRKIGWKVKRDERIHRQYRCLSPSHRYCRFGDLEASLQVNGRHLQFEMFQNVKMSSREPGDGKYEFNKLELMPYLMKLRALWTFNKLTEFFVSLQGYQVTPPEPKRGPFGVSAVEWIHWKYKEGWHYNEELGRPDWGQGKWNRTSGDKKLLEHKQPVYFADYDGRWGRGVAYYNINNMWWIVVGKWDVRNIACFDIYVDPPKDLRTSKKHERVRRKRLEEELAKAICALDFKRAEILKRILFEDRKLYRIYSEKNELWWRTSAQGYTKDKACAGLYEEHELPRDSVDLRFEAVA